MASLKSVLKHYNIISVLGKYDYELIMEKLEGHDRELVNSTVDEFAEYCIAYHKRTGEPIKLRTLAEEFKEQRNLE